MTSVIPTRTIGLSGALGAGAGYFELNIYDDSAARRFALAIGGIQGEGLRIPLAAMPLFQAAVGVGGAQMFISNPIDLTVTSSGNVLVPAVPGYFLLPASADPLRVINLSSAGTMSVAPTIRCGNDVGHSNFGTGAMDAGAFVGSTARTTRPAFGVGQTISLLDLSAPIVLDVTGAGSGTAFAWSARFALAGFLVTAF